MMRVVTLLGPPCAGKDTTAESCRSRPDVVIVSTGGILRSQQQNDPSFPSEIARCMDTGQLVPDQFVGPIVRNYMNQLQSGWTYLFNGFPRREPQVKLLRECVDRHKQEGKPVEFITIEFKLSLSAAIRRCNQRRESDIAAGRSPRSDDRPDVVESRWLDYHRQYGPTRGLLLLYSDVYKEIPSDLLTMDELIEAFNEILGWNTPQDSSKKIA